MLTKTFRNGRQVEVHPSVQRLHPGARHQQVEVAIDNAVEQVQRRVRAHERAATFVVQGTANRRAGRRHGLVVNGNQIDVVGGLARTGHPRLHPAPEQDAGVRRLTTTTGVEGRAIQHDPVRPRGNHCRVPFAQRRVVELQSKRAHDVDPMA